MTLDDYYQQSSDYKEHRDQYAIDEGLVECTECHGCFDDQAEHDGHNCEKGRD